MEIFAHMGKNGEKRVFSVVLFYLPLNTPTNINQLWFNIKLDYIYICHFLNEIDLYVLAKKVAMAE